MSEDRAARGGRRANALAGQMSPYLLQHAHNPVDWRPWGPEAFEEARERDAPIFLSIGYSTCYWCHVMERESFEDPATATRLNTHFVPIKVDREERPDVDDVYMTATQLATGSGGWPMSVFLTPPCAGGEEDPGLKPFYAGTYFPKEPVAGRASFGQALEGITQAWGRERGQVLEQAESLAAAVEEHLTLRDAPVRVGRAEVEGAVTALSSLFDAASGGFGGAPKFPQPVYLELLLDAHDASDNEAARQELARMLDTTLRAMAMGGVFDQIGGGFHRYAVDAHWITPHFEKMLYDQGQLLRVYARRHAQAPDPLYERVIRMTAAYVEREMTDAGGGLYSAQDAEVGGREGASYTWTPDLVLAALGGEDAAFAMDVFGVAQGPNFRDPHHPEASPVSVLRLIDAPDALAARLGTTTAALFERLERVGERMLAARDEREGPARDEKTIASWNGLMISGLAAAGEALGEPGYIQTAARAVRWVLGDMRDGAGELVRARREGVGDTRAFLEDYANMIAGVLAIHRSSVAPSAGGEEGWLAEAIGLAGAAKERFWDEERGGFYDTAQCDLFVRARTTYDGAIPGGASVMLCNLLDLHELTGEAAFLDDAMRALASVSAAVTRAPAATSNTTRALLRVIERDPELIERAGMIARRQDGLPEDAGPEEGGASPGEVEIYASAREVVVGAEEPAELGVELRIPEGLHVTAHDPGVEGLVGLRVRVVGGEGVRAIVSYPEGEPIGVTVAGVGGAPLRAHTERAHVEIELVRSGVAWSGSPRLELTHQLCSDRACYAPTTVLLGVDVLPG